MPLTNTDLLAVYREATSTAHKLTIDELKSFVGDSFEIPSAETPPSGATPGELWFNETDGRLYYYYDDGNTEQWVDASPAGSGGGGGGDASDLQSVTDEGNTTTNEILIGGTLPSSPKITLAADGSITAAGNASINGLTVGRGAGNNALNTALGSSALVANSTGSVNTAVGGNALLSNDTGERNTGIGYNALRSCTTATNNTAVGVDALFAATSGIEQANTAVGDQSGNRLTTGSRNTVMGYQALFSTETGTKNVAIGDGAGYFIEGSNNTILGAYRGPSGQTALSDTVIISAGATEKLRIDSTGSLLFGGTLPAAPKITLNASGSATFKGTNNLVSIQSATDTGYCGLSLKRSDSSSLFDIYGYDNLSSEGPANVQLWCYGNNDMLFATNSIERLRIDSTGSLLFGGTLPAAPKIQLNSDGSASYASGDLTITKAGRLNSTEVNTYGTAGFIANGTNNTSLDWAWRGSFGGANTSSIDYNGTATFAGTITSGGVNASQAQGLDVFTGSVSGKSGATSIISADGIAVFASGNFEVTSSGFTKIRNPGNTSALSIFPSDNFTDPASIQLKTNGKAEFTGNTTIGTLNLGSDTASGFLFVPDGLQYAQRPASSPNEPVYSAWKGQVKTINLTCGGDASFTGSVTASNVTFNLEADDDTKYTSTTNEDGEQTLVYNGAVLDVKDRLTKIDTALTDLKSALVTTTDHASLKAALIAALADI